MDFRRQRKPEAQIDMTPMIDTLLQLFVVFLLSMSFVASAVRLELPRATLQQPAGDRPVVVSIDADNHWFVNNEPVGQNQLSAHLAALLPRANQREVLLRADRSLVYDKVLVALVEIQKAGVANIVLAYEEGR